MMNVDPGYSFAMHMLHAGREIMKFVPPDPRGIRLTVRAEPFDFAQDRLVEA